MNTPSEGRKTTFQDERGFPPGAGSPATSIRDPRSRTLDTQTAQDGPRSYAAEALPSGSRSPWPSRTQVLTEVIGSSPTQPSKGPLVSGFSRNTGPTDCVCVPAQRGVYVKELACEMVRADKSKICRAGQ